MVKILTVARKITNFLSQKNSRTFSKILKILFAIHSVPKMKNFARGDSVRPGFYDQEVKKTQQSGKNTLPRGLKDTVSSLEVNIFFKKWIFSIFCPKIYFSRHFFISLNFQKVTLPK